MNLRTDLILENDRLSDNNSSVKPRETIFGECTLSEVRIETQEASNEFSKPIGKYFTAKFKSLLSITDTSDIKKAITYALNELLPIADRESVLVVGLGNSDITPDALGPFTAGRILATRHIDDELKKRLNLENLKCVSALIPGVIGKTGIEAAETIGAAAERITPSAIIAIDALAACCAENLCCTVQLSDSGICPGSGVNNSRKELSRQTLNVPVIAIGIPTVTDSATVTQDGEKKIDMMVTPKEIDLLITKSSELLAETLNTFLQPELEVEILAALT